MYYKFYLAIFIIILRNSTLFYHSTEMKPSTIIACEIYVVVPTLRYNCTVIGQLNLIKLSGRTQKSSEKLFCGWCKQTPALHLITVDLGNQVSCDIVALL